MLEHNPLMDALLIGIFLAVILCVGVVWWAVAIVKAIFRRNVPQESIAQRVDS
jgi:hypothetical protein